MFLNAGVSEKLLPTLLLHIPVENKVKHKNHYSKLLAGKVGIMQNAAEHYICKGGKKIGEEEKGREIMRRRRWK